MNADTITQETLEQISKAVTVGMNSSTGAFGVDLIDLVSLVPVDTPFRDMLAREGGKGADVATWRALLNINAQQPSPFTGLDNAGGVIKTSIQTVSSPYLPLAAGYSVTEDAIARAGGFVDAKAIEIFQALNQWKIQEDKALIGAQSFNLPQPATPTLTVATTGGTIGAVTATIGVAARTGAGYFWTAGNSRGSLASTSALSGSTNKVTAAIPSVRGAVAYDWFYSVNGGTTWFYATTTTVPTYTFTAGVAANQTPPSLPDMTATVPTINTAADNGSGDSSKQFNGLLATLAGDYTAGGPLTTPGSGTSSGAIWQDSAGAALTVAGGGIKELDQLNKSLYDTARLSATAYMVSSQEANSISSIVLNNPGAVTYLSMNDAAGRSEVVAGGVVATYLNRSKPGSRIRIEAHPHVPPGTIIARTDSVPYPGSNITNTLQVRTLREVYDYVYGSDRASGGPRQDGESRSVETLVNFAPCVMGCIQGVAAS